MQDLEKKLRAIRRRLVWRRMVDWATWGMVGGMCAVALALLVRVFFPYGGELLFPAVALVFGCMLAGAVAALFKGTTLFEAALRADAHLGLQERLSSAWLLARQQRQETPAMRTLFEDAMVHAHSIHPGRDFRTRFPRHGKHTLWPAVGIVVLLFAPSYPLFTGGGAGKTNQTTQRLNPAMTSEERANLAEELRELARQERERRLEASNAEIDLAERMERLARDLEMGNTDRLDTLAELSRLNEEAQTMRREADRQRQPFRQLSGLQQAQQTQELQRALKDGDFQKAAEQFEELANRIGEMEAEDLRDLAQEMQQLADQLKDSPGMAEALQQAAEAIEQMAQEKQQQQQQQAGGQTGSDPAGQQSQPQPGSDGQDQGASQQQGQQSATPGVQAPQAGASQQALSQAADGLRQASERAQNLNDLRQQIEQLAQIQESLSQCMGSCMGAGSDRDGNSAGSSGQPGGDGDTRPGDQQGQFAQGDTVGEGGTGSGGPGRGQGGTPPEDPNAPVGFQDVFIAGDQHEGEIIAVFEGEGLVPAGEATLNYQDVPMEVRQRAARSVNDTRIPAGHRGSVRDYFEAIHFSPGQE